jgi:hypothetical protein
MSGHRPSGRADGDNLHNKRSDFKSKAPVSPGVNDIAMSFGPAWELSEFQKPSKVMMHRVQGKHHANYTCELAQGHRLEGQRGWRFQG